MNTLKKILWKIINLLNKTYLRRMFLGFFIFLNNISYDFIKLFVNEPGKTPAKHKIVKYFNFFEKNIKKTDIVLDIGCAEGYLAYRLSKKTKKIIGIEILKSKFRIAKNRYKNKNLIFAYGDATKYNYEKFKIKKFDKIILSNVLEHIEHRIKFLKELTKLSDTILLRVPMITRDWLAVFKKEHKYKYKLDPTHYTEYTLEEIFLELDKSGWKIESYYIDFGEFYGIIKKK